MGGIIKTNRIAWIDNVKMFAMVAVLFGHFSSLFSVDSEGYEVINLFIVAFNMPLFAVVSGYTVNSSLNRIVDYETFFDYTIKVAKRIALPCLTMTLLVMVVVYAIDGHLVKSILSAMLLLLPVATYSLARFDRYRIATRILLTICLMTIFINMPYWYFNWYIISVLGAAVSVLFLKRYLYFTTLRFCLSFLFISACFYTLCPYHTSIEFYLYFMFGNMMASCKLQLSNVQNYLAFMASLIAGVFFFSLSYGTENQFYLSSVTDLVAEGKFNIFLFRQLSGLSLSFFFILFVKKISSSYTYLSYCGSQTLAIYTLHLFFLSILKKMLVTPFNVDVNVYLLANLGGAFSLFFVCVALINLLMKYNITRLLILGKR